MRNDMQAAPRGGAVVLILAVLLAWTGMLVPAQAQDELTIHQLSLQTDRLGKATFMNVNRDGASVRIKRDKQPLTPEQEDEIAALVAALPAFENRFPKLQGDLSPYGIRHATIGLKDVMLAGGERLKISNISVRQGSGVVDPNVAALLAGLLTFLDASAPAASGKDIRAAADAARAIDVEAVESAVSAVSLYAISQPFRVMVSGLDTTQPTIIRGKGGTPQPLQAAAAARLREMCQALEEELLSDALLKMSSFSTTHDLAAHGVDARVLRLEIQGDYRVSANVKGGAPGDSANVRALLDYLIGL